MPWLVIPRSAARTLYSTSRRIAHAGYRQAAELAEALREKFAQMGPQTLRLDELRQGCMEDTGLEVPMAALREALAVLERDGVVRTSRQATVQILS